VKRGVHRRNGSHAQLRGRFRCDELSGAAVARQTIRSDRAHCNRRKGGAVVIAPKSCTQPSQSLAAATRWADGHSLRNCQCTPSTDDCDGAEGRDNAERNDDEQFWKALTGENRNCGRSQSSPQHDANQGSIRDRLSSFNGRLESTEENAANKPSQSDHGRQNDWLFAWIDLRRIYDPDDGVRQQLQARPTECPIRHRYSAEYEVSS